MQAVTRLARLLAESRSMLVGFSGGVDSALLAVVAREMLGPDRSLAVLAVSPSLARRQREQAHAVAAQFGLTFEEVSTGEVEDPRYRANPSNRCFFCKQTLWSTLKPLAAARGLAHVADGTNADDVAGHRPGHAAAAQLAVRSPLLEAGLTKSMIRAEARRRNIPVWDAPSSPCLASRVRFGIEVNPETLRRVEAGEELLRAIGVHGDLRVRHRGDEARIEVEPNQFDRVRGAAHRLNRELKALGWTSVTLDLGGYRSGSQLGQPSACEPLVPA